jgi:hypothetical protein
MHNSVVDAHAQILSDAKLRENYNKFGRAGTEGAPVMDSTAFFAMVFGSEKFEPLVGEMKVRCHTLYLGNMCCHTSYICNLKWCCLTLNYGQYSCTIYLHFTPARVVYHVMQDLCRGSACSLTEHAKHVRYVGATTNVQNMHFSTEVV